MTVDVMPTLPEVPGFSNRWYPQAALTALPSGARIRVINAPAFLATKFEAFHGPGQGDYLFSHDLGDVISVISVIDGRAGLVDEVQQAPPDLASYICDQIRTLLTTRAFRDSVPGHLPGDAASQARLPDLETKLNVLAALRSA